MFQISLHGHKTILYVTQKEKTEKQDTELLKSTKDSEQVHSVSHTG